MESTASEDRAFIGQLPPKANAWSPTMRLRRCARELIDGDDGAEQQNDDGQSLGLVATADRQAQRFTDATSRRPHR